jgi:hypothetical protein
VPEHIRAAGSILPPRTNPQDKTEGVMLVGDRVHHDPLFTAEPDGRIRSRQIRAGNRPAAGIGLKKPLSQAIIMDHVEAQAAAIMRRDGGPKEASLVINQAPCDDPVLPLVCEKMLPNILPAGSQLTVYLSDGQQTRPYKTYRGTGEGIAP